VCPTACFIAVSDHQIRLSWYPSEPGVKIVAVVSRLRSVSIVGAVNAPML
jgi:hypothetical protein